MHGLGNDFVFVPNDQVSGLDIASLAAEVSDRKKGIGCDQFITYAFLHSNSVVEMNIYNTDGSIARACGNATRCMMKLINLQNGCLSAKLNIWGREVNCNLQSNGLVVADMGNVSFEEEWMPYRSEILELAKTHSSNIKNAICADMGNRHLIFFIDKSMSFSEKELIGSLFEKGKPSNTKAKYERFFPEGVNVNFAILESDYIDLIVWERSAGFTAACGTGACATVAAAYKLGLIDKKSVKVNFPEGSLEIELNNDRINMAGDANFIAEGKYNLEHS